MPAPNHLVLASGAAVAVSVAVATALAIYENPELRRYADDVRRRIAIALHSIGDGINPPHREPLFNRPEDAHGFLQSGAEPGVDADEETRRRQREELLYWNSVLLQKEAEAEKEKQLEGGASEKPKPLKRMGTFDDFLKPDSNAEEGTYVFNSGADVKQAESGLRHRGDAARGFSASTYANPFADEHSIGNDDLEEASASQIAPGKDEVMSDIYSVSTVDNPEPRTPTAETPVPSLIDLDDNTPARTESSRTVEQTEPDQEDEYMTAGQDDRGEAYASIQAWAQNSAPEFYSPLPSTPAEPQSEPELVSDGELTPTDSMSLTGSGEDIADEARSSSHGGAEGRPFDVISESDGMMTPASWSEIGSVVSESDAPVPAQP